MCVYVCVGTHMNVIRGKNERMCLVLCLYVILVCLFSFLSLSLSLSLSLEKYVHMHWYVFIDMCIYVRMHNMMMKHVELDISLFT